LLLLSFCIDVNGKDAGQNDFLDDVIQHRVKRSDDDPALTDLSNDDPSQHEDGEPEVAGNHERLHFVLRIQLSFFM